MQQQEHGITTGTTDVTYNLISVAYHALQGADNYSIYAMDAEQNGDDETAQFFRALVDEERRRADRAKDLLLSKLQAQK